MRERPGLRHCQCSPRTRRALILSRQSHAGIAPTAGFPAPASTCHDRTPSSFLLHLGHCFTALTSEDTPPLPFYSLPRIISDRIRSWIGIMRHWVRSCNKKNQMCCARRGQATSATWPLRLFQAGGDVTKLNNWFPGTDTRGQWLKLAAIEVGEGVGPVPHKPYKNFNFLGGDSSPKLACDELSQTERWSVHLR